MTQGKVKENICKPHTYLQEYIVSVIAGCWSDSGRLTNINMSLNHNINLTNIVV